MTCTNHPPDKYCTNCAIAFIANDHGSICYKHLRDMPKPLPPIYEIPVPLPEYHRTILQARSVATPTILVGKFVLGRDGMGNFAYWLEDTYRR